ncbi:RNA polymerase II C-terminal domain phosphatase-like 3 [Acorus calamus]|uniref:RNA polymerase II C-terminal domain phosphatase-like n=1 Tax=Acorus calamus TaxID=4465 RepID=A0AAV9EZ85_ACOCL|nr:RNA polymerase II C-terminal domain phosphatase-like 3 [Acorus calamus]
MVFGGSKGVTLDIMSKKGRRRRRRRTKRKFAGGGGGGSISGEDFRVSMGETVDWTINGGGGGGGDDDEELEEGEIRSGPDGGDMVFLAMDVCKREQIKDPVSRMTDYAKSRDPPPFPLKKLTEIEDFLKSLVSVGSQTELSFNSDGNSTHFSLKFDHNLIPLPKKPRTESISVKPKDSSTLSNNFVTQPTIPPSGRVDFSHLIDLHTDANADSLPSPTREIAPPLPPQRSLQQARNCCSQMGTGSVALHPYMTKALKTISSHQQKFGHTSLIASTRLQSPTPSEECANGDADDPKEVSSSSVSVSASRPVDLTMPSVPVVCGTTVKEKPILNACVKSRDPRLIFANHEAGVLDINMRPVLIEDNVNRSGTNGETSPTEIKNSQNEVLKFRLKPRDPRCVLFNNTVARESLRSEQAGIKGANPSNIHNKHNLTVREQRDQTEKSKDLPLLNIDRQCTNNIMNSADIVSSSEGIGPVILTKADNKVDGGNYVMDSNNENTSTSNQGTSSSQSEQFGNVDHLLDGYDDEQKAAIQKERTRRIEEQNKMFAARKLCLVLDLDHTLLNSAKFVNVAPEHDAILRMREAQERTQTEKLLFCLQHMGLWTKLRPGIWNFLREASKLFELHIYTMGNRLYANEMAKLLDPEGVLFAGRVMSRGDDSVDPCDRVERRPKIKDLGGVLGLESAVVIIDDSANVWPHHQLNLMAIERYFYFPCSRRQFRLSGSSLLEMGVDERAEDGMLASSLEVIKRIHQIFFSQPSLNEVDVRNILACEQRSVLRGCVILFSRVFPMGEANPHLHPLWRMAEQFGAVCTTQMDAKVTHVVAASPGTDKVNWARSTGKYAVHPSWIEASSLLYRRADEKRFHIPVQ